MREIRRRALRVLLAGATLVVIRTGLSFWGHRALSRAEDDLQTAMAQEERAFASKPSASLMEKATVHNEQPRLGEVVASFLREHRSSLNDYWEALKPLGTHNSSLDRPDVEKVIQACRPHLTELRRALADSGSYWRVPADILDAAGDDVLAAARVLGYGLVWEGHRERHIGHTREAAEYFIDAIRWGGASGAGFLTENINGLLIASVGVDAVGTLVSSQHLGSPRAAREVQEKLRATEVLLPKVERGTRLEGLRLRVLEGRLHRDKEAPAMIRWLVPDSAAAAWRMGQVDQVVREMERGVALRDITQLRNMNDVVSALAARNGSPVLREGIPAWFRARIAEIDLLTRLWLVEAALKLEFEYEDTGYYPSTTVDTWPAADAHGLTRKLDYRPLGGGKGYRLSTVGADRKELVLERKPPVD